MSKPALYPDTTPSGIAVDPSTLERVIPQSTRPDGTVRKEIKIKPGFTPQEDVGKFRTARQQEKDARALPKGHIIGWVPPSAKSNTTVKSSGTLSKSQKKNEKRKEKKKTDLAKKIKENWEDDDEDEIKPASKPKTAATGSTNTDPTADEVAGELEKLEVNN